MFWEARALLGNTVWTIESWGISHLLQYRQGFLGAVSSGHWRNCSWTHFDFNTDWKSVCPQVILTRPLSQWILTCLSCLSMTVWMWSVATTAAFNGRSWGTQPMKVAGFPAVEVYGGLQQTLAAPSKEPKTMTALFTGASLLQDSGATLSTSIYMVGTVSVTSPIGFSSVWCLCLLPPWQLQANPNLGKGLWSVDGTSREITACHLCRHPPVTQSTMS